jgi:hypothetical protein
VATKIKLKRSAVSNKVPLASQLEVGELALNTTDGKIYLKKEDSTISDTSQKIFQRGTEVLVTDNGTSNSSIVTSVSGVSKVIVTQAGTEFTESIKISPNKSINFTDDSGDSYVALQAPDSLDHTYILKLPKSVPLENSILSNDGDGNLSWGNPDENGGNRIYASNDNGNDANDGITKPVKTLKRAAQLAASLGLLPAVDPGNSAYYAKRLLADNRLFIQRETTGFIQQTFPGLTYDQETCERDVGLIVDAVEYDLILGGNTRSVIAGMAYYTANNASAAVVVANQKTETIASLEFAKNLSVSIIRNAEPTVNYQNLLTQVIRARASGEAAQSRVIELFDTVISVLTSGVAPTIVEPRFTRSPVTIYVSSGDFYVDNPIIIPDKVSVVGDSLRSVVIRPLNANKDMFRVRNGAYLTGITFKDGLNAEGVAIYTFDWSVSFDNPLDKSVDRAQYFGLDNTKPRITLSPYIQNCSIISFLGGNGIRVDGNLIQVINTPLIPIEAENPVTPVDGVPQQGKSMVANAFTMVSFGGTGWLCTNDAYAQIVSCFQIFCLNGSYAQSGGYLSITNSATNFGVYALRSSGYSQNSFEFDRGIIANTSTLASETIFTTIGTKRNPIDQYVIRIKSAQSNNDITAQFKEATTEVSFNASTSINLATNVITLVDHGFATDSVYYSNNGNPTILGLLEGSIYFIQVLTTSTFKIFNDSSLVYPVIFSENGIGTHKLITNVEEYFVGDAVRSHSSYQEFTLDNNGPYVFNPGQSILGSTAGFTNTAYVLSYDSTIRKLIVSNEFTLIDGNLQRVLFNNDSTITTIGGASVPSISVDTVTSIPNLFYTSTFRVVSTKQGNNVIDSPNAALQRIQFHRPSTINSSAHTWEFAGSGTDYNALPQNGGQGRGTAYEQYNELPGRVYSSGTNELGDFKVGDFIIAENKSGNITFRTRVTVGEISILKLSLSDVEISEFSIDVGLGDNEPGGPSNARVSTQRAVRSFIANRLGNVIDKDTSSNAVPGALVQLNSQGQINQDLLPPSRGVTTYTVQGKDERLNLSNRVPAEQVISGDNASETYIQRELVLNRSITALRGQVFGLTGNTGTGVLLRDYTAEDTISLVNVTGIFDTTSSVTINRETLSPTVLITTVGNSQTIVDNFFLKRDTSSQYLILYPGILYDFTGITTITGANSSAQGVITGGPTDGYIYSLDFTSLQSGTGYQPTTGQEIYFEVPLDGGAGIGAKATITVTNGSVTNVELTSSGMSYSIDDAVSVASGNIGGSGQGFSIQVLRADIRLYVNLVGSTIKFAATLDGPEYLEDVNADVVSITNLALYADTSFDSRDISLGGAVNYALSRITLPSHGYSAADNIIYNDNGNLPIGNLLNQRTYWVGVIDSNIIELYNNYGATSGSKVIFGESASGPHFFRKSVVNPAISTITVSNHGLLIGSAIRFSAAIPPSGILNNGYYYAGSVTQNGFTLHRNKSDALSSNTGITASPVSFSSTGTDSATITVQNVEIIGTVNTSSNLEENWGKIAQSTFDASNIVSGVMSPSRLAAVGAANSSTFLRGDSSWTVAVQNIRPVTGSPISVLGEFSTTAGIDYFYNSIEIGVDNADGGSGGLTFTNSGVVSLNKAQFIVENGNTTVRTGVIDAGLLSGNPGNYYTNPLNLVGIIPVVKGGTGLSTFSRGDILYSGSAGSLTQLGIGSANGVLTSNGVIPTWSISLTLGGTLAVSGVSTLASAIVTGAATVGTTFRVTGVSTLASAIVTGAATVGTTLAVTGATTLASAIVTGAATVGTTLAVTGVSTLASAIVTGAATVGTTFRVTGATTLAGVTTGAAALASANITGNVTVGGTLGVTGLATLATAIITNDAIISGVTVGRGAGNLASNTSTGYLALSTNTTGANNTASGYNALRDNTTGASNTVIGWQSGSAITTGSNNTIIGSYTGGAAPISATGNNFVVLSDGAGNVRQYFSGANAIFNGTITATNLTGTNTGDQTPASLGLGNVDNTSDANKPVSTAQQTALNLKANLASPALSGIPTAPTAAIGVSSTQLATTAYVNSEIFNDAAPLSHVGSSGAVHAIVSTTVNGFMIASDKVKLNGIATGATANTGTVTAVTGTTPIVSSGGTTPVLSMPAATSSVAGYLTSANWSTFNAKQPAGDYVVDQASRYPTIRPTLLLDFANSKYLDPRITFTRASTATVFDEKGVMQTVSSGAPRFNHNPVTGESLGLLMEESRTNLLTYSDRFDNDAWIKTNVSVIPNAMLSPNGMFTASKVVESTVNGSHAINLINGLPITSGTQYVYGFYAKAGERNIIAFSLDGGAWGGTSQKAAFNLTTGVSTLNLGATDSGMKLLGNGWYICWLVTAAATSSTTVGVRFYIRESANVEVYTGDGTSGVFLARAGLEAGAFPTSSIETPAVFTGRASTATFIGSNGLIQTAASGVARYQYTPSDLTIPPYLLLESARTNLFTNSEITNSSTGTTVVPNSSVAPDGTTTMDFIGEQTITGEHYAQDRVYAVTAGTRYVFSVFIKDGVKADRLYYHRIGLTGNFVVTFDPRTKTLGGTSGTAVAGYQELPNGIFRVWLIYTAEITANAVHRSQLWKPISGTSYLGELDSGMYVWGAQLELADNISSYIPTTGAQVTRAADTSTSSQVTRAADSALMTGVDFSSWYSQSEGSIYAEYAYISQLYPNQVALALFSSSTTNIAISSTGSGNDRFLCSNNGVSQ